MLNVCKQRLQPTAHSSERCYRAHRQLPIKVTHSVTHQAGRSNPCLCQGGAISSPRHISIAPASSNLPHQGPGALRTLRSCQSHYSVLSCHWVSLATSERCRKKCDRIEIFKNSFYIESSICGVKAKQSKLYLTSVKKTTCWIHLQIY